MLPGFEELDRRSLGYRFDLEKDIPWERIDEPGLFFPRGYLASLGYDLPALDAHPAAHDLLQSALAVATCRSFADLEEDVISFLEDEHEEVPITRSALLLLSEEVKHTILFRRLQRGLGARRGGLDRDLLRHYRRPPGFTDLRAGREKLGEPAAMHYLFWLNTLFFEELTIYLFRALQEGAATIHPTWLEAHRCHLREEAQHVRTGSAYLAHAPLTLAARDRWSKAFFFHLHEDFSSYFGLGAVETLMAQAFPNLALYPEEPSLETRPFFQDLLFSPAFARTRAAAPYLARYAADQQGRSGLRR